ncbi:MAG: hypothetical protein ABL931_05955 [Usitatibacteraceae bacterium]
MDTQIRTIELKQLIVLTAQKRVDLPASKVALESLVVVPGFEVCSAILLDLRDVDCDISVTQVFELASDVAQKLSSLNKEHRVAVLVNGHVPGKLVFNNAQFLELCADKGGANIRAYTEHGEAVAWLGTLAPHADAKIVLPRTPAPSTIAAQLQ